jgi:hypothetical protein
VKLYPCVVTPASELGQCASTSWFVVSTSGWTPFGALRSYGGEVRLADPPRPVVVDTVLALGLLAAAQIELWVLQTPTGSRPLILTVAVLACVPLILRRRAPLIGIAGAVASIALPFLLGFNLRFHHRRWCSRLRTRRMTIRAIYVSVVEVSSPAGWPYRGRRGSRDAQ